MRLALKAAASLIRSSTNSLPSSPFLGRVQPLAAIVPSAVEWHPISSGNGLPVLLTRWNLLAHLQVVHAVLLVHVTLELRTIAWPITTSATEASWREGITTPVDAGSAARGDGAIKDLLLGSHWLGLHWAVTGVHRCGHLRCGVGVGSEKMIGDRTRDSR